MIRSFFLAIALLSYSGFAASSHANTSLEAPSCATWAKKIKSRQGQIQSQLKKRDELALAAEDAGEAWENAEGIRHMSAAYAQEADQTYQDYLTAKETFEDVQTQLMQSVDQLNRDMAKFNKRCAAK